MNYCTNMKILLILNSGIGNSILAIPAMKILRKMNPHAKITLIGFSQNLDIMPHENLVDEMIPVAFKKCLLRSLLKYSKFWHRYDLAICFFSSWPGRLTWLKKLGMIKEIITVPDQLNSENLISFPETEINMILLRSCGLIHSYTRVHPDILLTKKEISEAISYLHNELPRGRAREVSSLSNIIFQNQT